MKNFAKYLLPLALVSCGTVHQQTQPIAIQPKPIIVQHGMSLDLDNTWTTDEKNGINYTAPGYNEMMENIDLIASNDKFGLELVSTHRLLTSPLVTEETFSNGSAYKAIKEMYSTMENTKLIKIWQTHIKEKPVVVAVTTFSENYEDVFKLVTMHTVYEGVYYVVICAGAINDQTTNRCLDAIETATFY